MASAEHAGARTFTYDPLGNLRQRLDTSAGPDISYAYDPFNRLQSMSVGLAFGYDGRGNTNSISGVAGTEIKRADWIDLSRAFVKHARSVPCVT